MESFLINAYKVVTLIVYLYLSSALLYKHLVRRWVVFTAAYVALYLVGGAVFFGGAPSVSITAPDVDLPTLIRVVLLLGIAGVVGYGFLQEERWDFDRLLGGVLTFVVLLTAFVVLLHTFLGAPTPELPWWLFPSATR